MNSLERRALLIKRKKARIRRRIIFFASLFVVAVTVIFFLVRGIIFPPDVVTEDEPEIVVAKEPYRYYNPYYQPLDLDIKDYTKKEDEPVSSPIKLIEDNASVVDIEAAYSVVIDAVNMTVLYNKNGSTICYPASTTKVMTSLIALENCDEEYIFEVGKEIDMIKEGSSIAYLEKGERLTLNMLIDGLILPSGNDAAYSIAVNIARYINPNPKLTDDMAVELFCKMMTDRAKAIGALNTNFTVPDGFYDENHYTTAYDMGLIAFEALNNPTIKETVSKGIVRNVFVTGEDVTWINTNALLHRGGPYYYPYASGIKTGSNDESGSCLLSYAEKDGKKLIAVVLNSTPAGRWEDTIKLFEYFFGEGLTDDSH